MSNEHDPMGREQMSALVADVIAEQVERVRTELRAEMLEKMLALRTPTFALTPMGELYIDGQRVGDVRPLFQRVVEEALKSASTAEAGDDDC